jgi:spore coat protein CotH
MQGQSIIHPANNDVFLQNEVAEVHISLSANNLNTLLGDSLYSDYHFPATFYYYCSAQNDTIQNVGFRVRGNTSRGANKKGFKISFNEYTQGKKFKGIEKMNLVGQHNDPSLLRYWMSLTTLNTNDLISSRSSYVKLYINGQYKGIYLNVEHIDDEFLEKRFIGDDHGNLYKCTWGADLKYKGSNQSSYYGPYELKTNKSANDYSDLIQFIQTLNSISDGDFPCFIEDHFEVELYLKTLAAEMIIGHWDGYAFNKNNYYLYQQPSNGKFVFIEYDMDNTFGIDWFGIDWANRDLNNWHSNDRPLVERLLSYPFYNDLFNSCLSQILNNLNVSGWYSDLQDKKGLISSAVQSDSYYSMDYGFQYSDFLNAIDNNYGAHVTNGVAEYLNERINSGLNQIQNNGNQSHPCLTSTDDFDKLLYKPARELVKILDIIGRETIFKPNVPLIYLYKNGTVEKVIKIDQ